MHRGIDVAVVFLLVALPLVPVPINADPARKLELDISVRPLADALKVVADAFDLKIAFFSDDTTGLEAPPLTGSFSAPQAFDALLAGTALEHVYVNSSSVAIRLRSSEEAVTQTELSPDGGITMSDKKSSLIARVAGALSIGLFGSGSVAAEDSDGSARSGQAIEEIVVTARYREENSQKVPIPISALSVDELTSRGITEIKNIEHLTPNLSFIASAAARGNSRIHLRGIGQTSFNPSQDTKVGIYVDGVYLARQQAGIFDLLDIERIEVLRGPQGTLFGRNTTAGLINVITKAPHDEFEAKVSLGAGNQGQINGDAFFNVPISDNLAARFAFQARKDDGWMEDMSGREWNTTNSRSFRGALLWTPSDDLSVTIAGDYYRARETVGLANCNEALGGPVGLNFFTLVWGAWGDFQRACSPDNDPYKANDNDPNDLNQDAYTLSLNVTKEFENFSLTSITAYRDTKDRSESISFGTDFVGSPSTLLDVLQDRDATFDQWSQEFRLSGSALDDRMQWTAGVYFFKEEAYYPLAVYFWRDRIPPDPADSPLWPAWGAVARGVQAGASNRNETITENESKAVFAEMSYDLTDKLAVTAGIRWTGDDRELTRGQTTLNFTPTNVCPDGTAQQYCTVTADYDDITPRVIFNYEFNDDVMVFGGWSRGWSSGGIVSDPRMQPFEPEISDNFEIGIKSRWSDGRLQVNANAFHNQYKNHQVALSRLIGGVPVADMVNAQKATLQGVEVEIQAAPGDDWFMTFAWGRVWGDYDEFNTLDSTSDVVTGETMFFEADWSDYNVIKDLVWNWSLSVAKDFRTPRGDVTALVGWSQKSRIYSVLQNHERSKQPSYGLLDARVTWKLPNDKTSVSLWGTNLTDKLYFRQAQDAESIGVLAPYWEEPRRYGLTLSHRL